MYGIINSKTDYVFLKRDPDVSSDRVIISETFNGQVEPIGPFLVWIAATAAAQALIPHGDHPHTHSTREWATTQAQQAALAAALTAPAPVPTAHHHDQNGDGGSRPKPGSPPRNDPSKRSRPQAGPSSNTRLASKRARLSSADGALLSQKLHGLPLIEPELLEIGRTSDFSDIDQGSMVIISLSHSMLMGLLNNVAHA